MELLPETWADKDIEISLSKEVDSWKEEKKRVASRFKIQELEAVASDLEESTLAEVLAANFCDLSGNSNIRGTSASLQAFQTYRISLYDIRVDEHYEKHGKPTFLKTHGVKYVKSVEGHYKKVVDYLAELLERQGVASAKSIARNQYQSTLKADKERNKKRTITPTPEESIKINEGVAGNTAKNIAYLSGSTEQVAVLSASLVDAMCTIEDLLDIVNSDDLMTSKTTIPVAFFRQEYTSIPESKEEIKFALRASNTLHRTRQYIFDKLVNADNILEDLDVQRDSFLRRLHKRLNLFTEDFHKYLKSV